MEKFRGNPLLKVLYKLPLAPWLYHTVLAFVGACIYKFPASRVFVIGVTGTKGKSTTIELINAILEAAGKKTAILSSVRVKISDQSKSNPFDNTMPGRFFIQQFLSEAVGADCQYAIIEVTSQGVAFNRHLFIYWRAGIFINLSAEHIEAHGSFEEYRQQKLKFFRYTRSLGGRIFVNKDDRNSRYFKEAAGEEVILYSKSELPSQLAGDFNKYNIGAAAAVGQWLGINEKIIQKAIAEFPGVPGRMEFIQKKPFVVVVDYAHTPDSLRKVYETLRAISHPEIPTKLICVLGSAGGGRDRWKRPEMGRIASEMCDQIILTNEDPYDEHPEEIIEQIASGIHSGHIHKILDRREAIKKAISLAQSRDTVVITGKGSERWIHLANGQRLPWSDKETIEAVIKGYFLL